MKRLLAATAACLLSSGFAYSAEAAQYILSYSGTGVDFSATVTTSDMPNSNGFYSVTNLAGTRNGFAVTLLPPFSFGGNSNLFTPSGYFVDAAGISFRANGVDYNFYRNGNSLLDATQGSAKNVIATIGAATSAVPEPATWAMMLVGFGGIGFAMRRRKVTMRIRFA